MATIGTLTPDHFSGDMQPATQRVRVLERAGSDYWRAQQMGLAAPAVQLVTHNEYTTDDDAVAAAETIEALAGTTLDITDNADRTYENCLVEEVRTRFEQTQRGTATQWWVIATWTVRAGRPD